MNNEPKLSLNLLATKDSGRPLDVDSTASCERAADSHCITCSDEALIATVLRVDEQMGLASVTVDDASDEVDITLLDEVAVGDQLLVHGGVAIARIGENSVSEEAKHG